MSGSIASAVVLPEPEEAPPQSASPPNPHKRRQSSVTEDSAKRPRVEGDDAATDRRGSTTDTKPAAPARRERGRERRLFGAALGALSQNSATAGQKRRLEIEKRQLAQRKQENEETEQRKAERAAKRKTQRWREQKLFETRAMKMRHDNLFNMAHFLYTETEPRLYYKPWEMSAEEQDRIDDQIAEVRATIRRELDEYDARQEQEGSQQGRASTENREDSRMDTSGTIGGNSEDAPQPPPAIIHDRGSTPQDQDMKDEKDEHTTSPADAADKDDRPPPEPMQDTWPPNPEVITEETNKDDDDDDNGEEVVEAAEDTVIY